MEEVGELSVTTEKDKPIKQFKNDFFLQWKEKIAELCLQTMILKIPENLIT